MPAATGASSERTASEMGDLPATPMEMPTVIYPEDAVDSLYFSEKGLVKGERTTYCNHGRGQKCTHCLDKDPWDEEYLKSKGIKHHSAHSELKRLTQYHGKSKAVPYPLSNVKCTVKPGCTTHKPYPEACCSHCQPATLMLALQKYRHLDYIEFESQEIVSQFIDYWRKTGKQRAGYMLGRYDKYDGVPLGIKATVCAIYEPPQTSTTHSLQLLDDPRETQVDALLKALNLKLVGWIFTDLEALPNSAGKVRYTRTPDTYFLTAQECITAGALQNKYRQGSRFSEDGYFGSRFATVVVTGDQSNQIHLNGWQVSDQCTALVEAQLVVPVAGRPELGYIRPNDKPAYRNQYIPQVLYTKTDKYKNKITRDARPLPVEFFLVDVPNGAPINVQLTFSGIQCEFPGENRSVDAADSMTFSNADLAAFGDYMSRNTQPVHVLLANWRVLYFIATSNANFPEDARMTDEQLLGLCKALVAPSAEERTAQWMNECAAFNNLVMYANDASISASVPASSAGDGGVFACPHCTYLNAAAAETCAICGLPLRG